MQLNYIQTGGDNPPLVIMHGLFGSARNWQGIAKQLSERFTVYTVDLRNHGSSPHADKMDYLSMAVDVQEFMVKRGINEAVILGHSMGGKVAMQLALTAPQIVRKLVVVDIAPVTYKHNFDDVLSGLEYVPLLKIKSRKEADQYLAEKIEVPSLRQFLLQNLVVNPSGGYQWRVNLASIKENMQAIMGFPHNDALTHFSKQTLFINGEKSTYLASRYRGVAADIFTEAEFQTVVNSGHWPHIESPAEFMSILNKFLS